MDYFIHSIIVLHGWQLPLLLLLVVVWFLIRKMLLRGVNVLLAIVAVYLLAASLAGIDLGIRYDMRSLLHFDDGQVLSKLSSAITEADTRRYWPSMPVRYRHSRITLINVINAPPYNALGLIERSRETFSHPVYRRYVAVRARVEGLGHDILLFAGQRGTEWIPVSSDMYKPEAMHYGCHYLATIYGMNYDLQTK